MLSGPPRDYSEPEHPKQVERPRTLAIAMALLTILIGIVLLGYSVQRLRAHDAPTGWNYPFACCSGMDCRPIPEKAISERAEGYVVPSGEVVGYQDTRLKDSPDGAYHWCTVAGADDGRTICLFIPPRGM
jgi:hypothetical protein